MAFQFIADAVADGIFGTRIFNELLESIDWFKSVFDNDLNSHEFSSGTHRRNGFYVYGTLHGAGASAPTVTAATSFRITDTTRNSVGDYTVNLSVTLPRNAVLIFGTDVLDGNVYGQLGSVGNEIQVYNETFSTQTLTELASSTYIYLCVLIPE